MRHLGRGPDRQRVRHRIKRCQAAARLHGQGHVTTGGKTFSHHTVSRLKRGLDLAHIYFQGLHDVVAPVFMGQGGVRLQRLFHVPERVERVVLDLDQRGGILGDIAVGGNNGCHHLTHKADFSPSQDRPIAGLMSGRICWVKLDPQRLYGLCDILAGDHRLDARVGGSGAGINVEETRVGIRAADKGDRQGIGQMDIVYILTFAQEHPWVFHPLDLSADHLSCSSKTGCHSVFLTSFPVLRWRAGQGRGRNRYDVSLAVW